MPERYLEDLNGRECFKSGSHDVTHEASIAFPREVDSDPAFKAPIVL